MIQKTLISLFASVTILLTSCESSTSKETEEIEITAIEQEPKNERRFSSVADSIGYVMGADHLDSCHNYLDKYYDSKNPEDLDSAMIQFAMLRVKNKEPMSYLGVGTCLEAMNEKNLAYRFYKEGRLANEKRIEDPNFSDLHTLYHLLDGYFAILLEQPFDINKLEELKKEVDMHPYLRMMIDIEGHTRWDIIDAFCDL